MAKKTPQRHVSLFTKKEVLIQVVFPTAVGIALYVWLNRFIYPDISFVDSLMDGLIFGSIWSLLQILLHRKRLFKNKQSR